MNRKVYYNGTLYAEDAVPLSPFGRGLHYGDGVFETMRCCGGSVFRLHEHLQRLVRGLAVLRIRPPEAGELQAAITAVIGANDLQDATVKIVAFRDGPAVPGPQEGLGASVLVTAVAFDARRMLHAAQGLAACIVTVRRNESSPLVGIKSLNYLENILGRLEARDRKSDEAIFLNSRGQVTEGATSNVFLVSGGSLATPPVQDGLLPGITRSAVIEVAEKLAMGCVERNILPAELAGADEIFLTNASLGVMPLVKLDGSMIGAGVPGPVTCRCMEGYHGLDGAAIGDMA